MCSDNNNDDSVLHISDDLVERMMRLANRGGSSEDSGYTDDDETLLAPLLGRPLIGVDVRQLLTNQGFIAPGANGEGANGEGANGEGANGANGEGDTRGFAPNIELLIRHTVTEVQATVLPVFPQRIPLKNRDDQYRC